MRTRILIFPLLAGLALLGLAGPVAAASQGATANIAAVSPAANCNAITPNGNGREVYNYTGRQLPGGDGIFRFEYLGDAGDFFYSVAWMGDSFVKFCI